MTADGISQIARYAIKGPQAPPLTLALQVGEVLRAALMGLYGAIAGRREIDSRSILFSGKDSQGSPLKGHRHAFFLSTDENGDGQIDHLSVFAPDGFPEIETAALSALNFLHFNRNLLHIHFIGVEAAPGPLGQLSTIWASTTPYVATRRAKFRGRFKIDRTSTNDRLRFLTDDLRSQLAQVRPDLVDFLVSVLPQWNEQNTFRVLAGTNVNRFQRTRSRADDSGQTRMSGAFRLVFAAPVIGPLALGWGNHFGMGLFTPDKAGERK